MKPEKHQLERDESSTSNSSSNSGGGGSSSSSKRRGGRRKQREQLDEIPLLDRNGRALSPQRRAVFATKMGLTKCGKCGMKTHKVETRVSHNLMKLKLSCHKEHIYLTNDDVYEGICIQCNPSLVPSKVLRQFQR